MKEKKLNVLKVNASSDGSSFLEKLHCVTQLKVHTVSLKVLLYLVSYMCGEIMLNTIR